MYIYIGSQHKDDIFNIIMYCIIYLSACHLSSNGQRFSFNNLRTGIVFPGSGIGDTLTSFRNQESLPQIHLPQSFLRSAKSKKDPLGKLTSCEHLVNMYSKFQ